MSVPGRWRAAIGRLQDGDLIRIIVDRIKLEGSLDLVGTDGNEFGADEGARVLAARSANPQLSADPDLPDDTRLWAALQSIGGGTWGGCVYDTDAIVAALDDFSRLRATSTQPQ